tara:strand:- start:19630 stop:19845 length:216 start_codon:yes stop_codon:yes gene_type:complete
METTKIKRYRNIVVHDDDGAYPGIEECDDGDLVLWEDVEKLLRQIETLKNDVYAAGDAYYQVASKQWLETK